MSTLHNKLQASPLLARVLPFFVFLVLTSAQGSFGPDSQFWVYLLKTLVGVWMIWTIWPLVGEMRWALSIEAVGGGLLVFLLWIGLDFPYPKLLETDDSWDLQKHFGEDLMMFWLFAGTRIVGSTLVVPLLEEVFYRSFLYRYILSPNWLFTPHSLFDIRPFLGTSLIFGLAHQHWLAGILCGMIYQGVVLRTNRLGDAITAHAITNLLLGLWVVTQKQWHFW